MPPYMVYFHAVLYIYGPICAYMGILYGNARFHFRVGGNTQPTHVVVILQNCRKKKKADVNATPKTNDLCTMTREDFATLDGLC